MSTTYVSKAQMILRNTLCVYGVVASIIAIFFGWKIIPHISSNETLIALSVVYFLPKPSATEVVWKNIGILLLLVVSVVFSNTSSPIGVLCVVLGSYFLIQGKFRYLWLSLIPLALAAWYYTPAYLFSDTMRFQAYRVFMGSWWNDSWWNVVFGYGPGSFEILSQLIQQKMDFMLHKRDNGALYGELWMHMHSDWLQFLWEYGVIGFGLTVACALRLLYALRGLVREQCVLIGCMASMIFDFPFRYPGVPLVFVLLFAIAFNEERYGEGL